MKISFITAIVIISITLLSCQKEKQGQCVYDVTYVELKGGVECNRSSSGFIDVPCSSKGYKEYYEDTISRSGCSCTVSGPCYVIQRYSVSKKY